ncbi:MAG: gamma-glutamyltransferase [Cardiobacteriaceae bacterium]|nr:gamma-glutamyltransferase [Cardiobacteriaceae bacterium]
MMIFRRSTLFISLFCAFLTNFSMAQNEDMPAIRDISRNSKALKTAGDENKNSAELNIVKNQEQISAEKPYQIYSSQIFHNAAISAADARAVKIAEKILQKGGNAADAAVAAGFAICVLRPADCGLGGGGFALYYDNSVTNVVEQNTKDDNIPAQQAENQIAGEHQDKENQEIADDVAKKADANQGKIQAFNFREEVFVEKSAVAVPGQVAGLLNLLEEKGSGKFSRAEIMQAAISLAEDGFAVTESLNLAISRNIETIKNNPEAAEIFLNQEQKPKEVGEILQQKQLAQTLKKIAELGADGFYQGEIAAEIAEKSNSFSEENLRQYQVQKTDALHADYRDFQITVMPAPSSSGVHLLQILNILEGYEIRKYPRNSAKMLHFLMEAMKFAYSDRDLYLASNQEIPTAGLINKDYADEIRSLIDPEHSSDDSEDKNSRPAAYESEETTHISIIDKDGNAAAITMSLHNEFGSGKFAGGFFLNKNNGLGRGKNHSAMSPFFILKEGKILMVAGATGGEKIIAEEIAAIIDFIDYNKNAAEIQNTPRLFAQKQIFEYENGFSADTVKLLEDKGHKLQSNKAHIAPALYFILRKDKHIEAASDPRNPDAAVGGY